MDTTTESQRRLAARYTPWIVVGTLLSGAVILGLVRGAPAVVLWLAFTMLSGAVILFWESLRLVLDPKALGDDIAFGDEEGVPVELEARKRAALRALRDIDFERAIQRLSDEDHAVLEKKYRAEARQAMVAIEHGLGPWITKAEEILKAEEATGGKPEASDKAEKTKEVQELRSKVSVSSPPRCAKCETANDADAVFCKKCGARIQGAVNAS